MRHTLGEGFAAMRLGSEIAADLLEKTYAEPVLSAFDEPPHRCRHFYVSIDDGLYLEKCVLCDKPKS
jgi:hypothetical protein